MHKKFKTARFHVSSGPSSLFERVAFKMQARTLKGHAEHFLDRAFERNIPAEKLIHFDPTAWQLKLVEVRTDTGKFISSTWSVLIDNVEWWVTIGLHNTMITAYNPNTKKVAKGETIIQNGELYDFVEKVNSILMEQESKI